MEGPQTHLRRKRYYNETLDLIMDKRCDRYHACWERVSPTLDFGLGKNSGFHSELQYVIPRPVYSLNEARNLLLLLCYFWIYSRLRLRECSTSISDRLRMLPR